VSLSLEPGFLLTTDPCRALSTTCAPVGLRVYVTGDGPDVFEETLMKIAQQDAPHFQPTLLLVGTRLGIDHVTPVYWDALKDALCMPQSVGIAGYVKSIDTSPTVRKFLRRG
jgi:hypothetical protein